MTKEFMRFEEVTEGINVIVDDRFVAFFPMENYGQVEYLVERANLAFKQRLSERHA